MSRSRNWLYSDCASRPERITDVPPDSRIGHLSGIADSSRILRFIETENICDRIIDRAIVSKSLSISELIEPNYKDDGENRVGL